VEQVERSLNIEEDKGRNKTEQILVARSQVAAILEENSGLRLSHEEMHAQMLRLMKTVSEMSLSKSKTPLSSEMGATTDLEDQPSPREVSPRQTPRHLVLHQDAMLRDVSVTTKREFRSVKSKTQEFSNEGPMIETGETGDDEDPMARTIPKSTGLSARSASHESTNPRAKDATGPLAGSLYYTGPYQKSIRDRVIVGLPGIMPADTPRTTRPQKVVAITDSEKRGNLLVGRSGMALVGKAGSLMPTSPSTPKPSTPRATSRVLR
jgi:hypothetical protein